MEDRKISVLIICHKQLYDEKRRSSYYGISLNFDQFNCGKKNYYKNNKENPNCVLDQIGSELAMIKHFNKCVKQKSWFVIKQDPLHWILNSFEIDPFIKLETT